MERIEIPHKIKYWFSVIQSRRTSAFLSIENTDIDTLQIVAKFLLLFLEEENYESCIILYTSGGDKPPFLLFPQSDLIEWQEVSEELERELCRLQRCFKVFSNLYFTSLTKYDDTSFERLIGINGISKKDVVLQVIFDMPFTMETGLDNTFKKDKKQRINWNGCREWTSQDWKKYENESDYVHYKIEDLKQRGYISCGDTVFLYGFSKLAREIVKQYHDIFNMYIIDKDTSKSGDSYLDVHIVDKDNFLSFFEKNNKVIITVLDYKNVCEEFVCYGYILGKNLLPIRYKKDYMDEVADDAIKELQTSLNECKKVYEELRKKFPKEYLLINPHASGDIYLSCMYLDYYLRENKISRYVFLVSNASSKKVAELFGIETVIWNKEKLYKVVKWARYVGFDKTKVKKMHLWVDDNRGFWQIFSGVDYNTSTQRMVFDCNKRRSTIALKQNNSDALFEKYSLVKEKTILLSPYSNTISQMDVKWFEHVASLFLKNGYSVCTNIFGAEETISGTLGLSIPYNQVLDFVNKAGYFIGARSGLCDVISTTSAKMVVLYRKDTYKHFSLVEMGLKTDDILELCVEDESKETFEKKAMDYIIG